MSNVFDRLHKKLELEKKDEGISILDLNELPPKLKKIMRFMLREVEIGDEKLRQEVEDLFDGGLSDAELNDALQVLTMQGWLIRRGAAEKVTYQVNLRRKKGIALAGGVWAALQARMIQHGDPTDEEHGEAKSPDAS